MSKDVRIAFATVQFDVRASGVPHSVSVAMLKDVKAASFGFAVAAGGQIISAAQSPSLSSEVVSIGAAAIILL